MDSSGALFAGDEGTNLIDQSGWHGHQGHAFGRAGRFDVGELLIFGLAVVVG